MHQIFSNSERKIAEATNHPTLIYATDVKEQLANTCLTFGIDLPSAEALNGLKRFLLANYSYLTSQEISLAFELSTTGKLQYSLETFGKPLNASMLSRVLNSYQEKRRMVLLKKSQRLQQMQVHATNSTIRQENERAAKEILQTIVEGGNLRIMHYQFIKKYLYEFTKEEKSKAAEIVLLDAKRQTQKQIKSQTDYADTLRKEIILSSRIWLAEDWSKKNTATADELFNIYKTKVNAHSNVC